MARSTGSLAFLVVALALLASAEAFGRRELLQSPAGNVWPFTKKIGDFGTSSIGSIFVRTCLSIVASVIFLPSDT